MKNWKRPIAAVLAGICCAVGIPQVQLVLPAMQAAAAETADTGTVGVLTYTLESDRAVITKCDENAEEVKPGSGGVAQRIRFLSPGPASLPGSDGNLPSCR